MREKYTQPAFGLAASRAIVVFTRAPADERRCKPLGRTGEAPAEVLHHALFERTLAVASAVPEADILLVTTGDLGSAYRNANRVVPAQRLHVLAQRGTSFAERFEHAAAAAFAAGYRQIVLIGGDTPELDTTALDCAFARLDSTGGAVLGPATDGGYYLLGLSRFTRAPFVDISFGTTTVCACTMRALERDGLCVSLLESLSDIDRLADVSRVAARLQRTRRPEDTRLLAALLLLLAPARAPVLADPLFHPALFQPLPHGPRGPPLCH